MKKILLFAGIGVAVIAISAIATYFIVAPKIAASAATNGAIAAPVTYNEGPTVSLDTRVLNLADPGANRYLKITVVIVFSPTLDRAGVAQAKVTQRQVVLQDIITQTVGDMTTTQLSTSAGKDALKSALKTQFAPVLVELHITDILFPEFVMQ